MKVKEAVINTYVLTL